MRRPRSIEGKVAGIESSWGVAKLAAELWFGLYGEHHIMLGKKAGLLRFRNTLERTRERVFQSNMLPGWDTVARAVMLYFADEKLRVCKHAPETFIRQFLRWIDTARLEVRNGETDSGFIRGGSSFERECREFERAARTKS